MKTLTYVGPSMDGVEIAATGAVCAKGGTVDVPDEIADALLEQPDAWAELPATTTKPKKEAAE